MSSSSSSSSDFHVLCKMKNVNKGLSTRDWKLYYIMCTDEREFIQNKSTNIDKVHISEAILLFHLMEFFLLFKSVLYLASSWRLSVHITFNFIKWLLTTFSHTGRLWLSSTALTDISFFIIKLTVWAVLETAMCDACRSPTSMAGKICKWRSNLRLWMRSAKASIQIKILHRY